LRVSLPAIPLWIWGKFDARIHGVVVHPRLLPKCWKTQRDDGGWKIHVFDTSMTVKRHLGEEETVLR
ncbi:MAG TPA: hypothetical protein VEU07_01425, partial [Candidatus Acidoferrum sp.]|nr:hypothetical protein [Candidatus Acidoferrum sp.]